MKKPGTILMPLTKQFAIILIIFIFCAACITIYSTSNYIRFGAALLSESMESYSAQLVKSAREAYESYENICYSVAYSQIVQKYLTGTDSQNDYELYEELEAFLENTALLNPYIIDVAVYGESGRFAAIAGSRQSYGDFAASLESIHFPYRAAGTTVINGISCHILEMPIYSLNNGKNHYLGLLFLAVDTESLLSNSLSSQDRYTPRIIFTDSVGQLVFGEELLYQALALSGGKSDIRVQNGSSSVRYTVSAYTVPAIQHTLYVLTDKSQLTRQVAAITGKLLLGMAAMICIVFLFLFLLYRPLIRSLKQLTDFMKTISSGNLKTFREGPDIHQGFISTSEINDISTAFHDMLTETDKLNHTIFNTYTRMYELESNNRQTEIAFLRSQINPHFLYNTLTMICGMAAEGMDDKIISVTGALSSIFRYSIKGSDLVPLREELEIVKSYLMIQKERFEDRISVRYELPGEYLDCLIPKMIIQPLVENSIVHGLEKNLEPGEILIGAGRNPEHGYLAVWIYDTGVGMPQAQLEKLRKAVAESSAVKSGNASEDLAQLDREYHESIGILNVNSRMVLYYGTNYTLLIDSEEGVGTNIQLRVPYQTK